MRARVISRASLTCLVVAAWSTTVAASATFPPVVDQHLMLTGSATIEKAAAPPDGCLLCHMSEAGGYGTNNAFGSLLREHGAVGMEPSTVGPALDAVEAIDPHAIDDIVMGINPNDDHTTPTVALPQPSYGCAAAPGPVTHGGASSLLLFASFALFAGRVRGRRAPS
jgi:hypothetical protein